MRFSHLLVAGLGLSAITAPAFAQEDTAPPPPFTISGSVSVLTDYRLRGISQTDKNAAIQGALTIAHESGFYIGTFGSNLSGWGTFGGANVELDAIGGFKKTMGSATVDAGVTWYTYPGGFSESDVVEFFGRLSGTAGPLGLTAGVYYAPKQTSLGNFSATSYSRGQREDNLYLTGDGTLGIPGTPITAKAHIGYSNGNPGLGPNGTSLAPTGEYWDWALGADVAFYKNLTFNVSYIDTDISKSESAYLQPNFSKGQDGTGQIAGATVLFGLTAAF
ncbi:TorF family putative porin [Sphingomonas sp. KR1UV-12]|uniref:TorF family putative porin n=1 Tax=Sphingomonas aurea TaxID=3063994 RepID=A0ABT9EKV1_9SPHN|nr:TorF family putative porin [Sphingomonas sp. KR1UV-12]MDP1027248.1 TorF family putative porin [Sphingomonas sp. KR1UV-12]